MCDIASSMSEEITAALVNSKYEDLVHVTLATNETESTRDETPSGELLLAARLDQENGGCRWEDVTHKEDPIARHVRTKIWLFPMLNDQVRTIMYEKAIQRAARDVVLLHLKMTQSSRSIHCMDIGSGTGLLAMMAAKYLQQQSLEVNSKTTIHVTSVEMSSMMAKLAKQTVAANGFAALSASSPTAEPCTGSSVTIDVIEGHSCELNPLHSSKAMLCTSELLESGLLGEGWLVAMRDAWKRHLSENAVVVPQRARVFAQLVQGIGEYWGPYRKVGGFPNNKDMSLFTNADGTKSMSESLDEKGNKLGVQVTVHLGQLMKSCESEIRFLSKPMKVLSFDVSEQHRIPGPEGQCCQVDVEPTASGIAEGVAFWWELDLYEDITYSTEPRKQPWQDHWHQCLYVFPQQAGYCRNVEVGKLVKLDASHNDTSIHFKIHCQYDDQRAGTESEAKRPRLYPIGERPVVSPQRCWMLNHQERSAYLLRGIRNAIKELGRDNACVLDISDFSLCAMMSSLLGAQWVTSIESSSGKLPTVSATVAQVANELPNSDQSPESFQMIRCHAEQLTKELLAGDLCANLVVGEPYFEFLEGHCVQEAFNYFNTLRMLKSKGVVATNALAVPFQAEIKARGIECVDIADAYSRCKDDACGGFDHSTVTRYWSFDQFPIVLPLYEYECRTVTESVTVATLDFESSTVHRAVNNGGHFVTSQFLEGCSTCHGVSFWVEYSIRLGNCAGSCSSSTNRASYRLKEQVLLLRTPLSSTEGHPLMVPHEWIDSI